MAKAKKSKPSKRPTENPEVHKALAELEPIEKAPSGISGLDDITGGGLPRGRTTIICGGPGCGKTMVGMEFLVRGAMEFDEPGVLMTFEETPEEMASNVASLGFNIKQLAAENKLFLDYITVDPSEIQETGSYDLEGLFIRLQYAVDAIGAKRVLLDTVEALFSGFSNTGVLRAEFRRLFRWLKDRNLTTIVTAERGESSLTRQGLEEYVSDCVILLDHRITEQTSARRMRIVKYRGTKHGADEYPFLIDEDGISILPVTALQLQHGVSEERISSGVPDLDEMLEGQGFYRGSTVLLSGTAGSGKTTLASSFAQAACQRGERCLFIDFEESSHQVARNMKSIGMDLHHWKKEGLLLHEAWRPTQFGIETHLLRIHKLIETFNPTCVVIDPVSNLASISTHREVSSMLVRLIDMLKHKLITAVLVSLTGGGESMEKTAEGISSLADTWILLRDVELNGERNRVLYVLKSRGMAHSNQLREFRMTGEGVQLIPAYVGPGGVLTGSARLAQEAKEKADALIKTQAVSRRAQELEAKRTALQAQIGALQAESTLLDREIGEDAQQDLDRLDMLETDRKAMSRNRDSSGNVRSGGSR
jgi:circadian clock protein KaiC